MCSIKEKEKRDESEKEEEEEGWKRKKKRRNEKEELYERLFVIRSELIKTEFSLKKRLEVTSELKLSFCIFSE